MLVTPSCLTLCDPLDCSPPGSSVHGISQARVLEWVDISFSRGSSQGPNPGLLHCRQILYRLSHRELVRTFSISARRSPPPPAPRPTSQNLHFNQVQRRQSVFKVETLCSPKAFVCWWGSEASRGQGPRTPRQRVLGTPARLHPNVFLPPFDDLSKDHYFSSFTMISGNVYNVPLLLHLIQAQNQAKPNVGRIRD